jgi:hypothetical protein
LNDLIVAAMLCVAAYPNEMEHFQNQPSEFPGRLTKLALNLANSSILRG